MIMTPNRALDGVRRITVGTVGMKENEVRRDVTRTSIIEVGSHKVKMKM